MPTLEERNEETKEDLKKRITEKQKSLDVSAGMANYIELMERYLLSLERRVNKLEIQISEQEISRR